MTVNSPVSAISPLYISAVSAVVAECLHLSVSAVLHSVGVYNLVQTPAPAPGTLEPDLGSETPASGQWSPRPAVLQHTPATAAET